MILITKTARHRVQSYWGPVIPTIAFYRNDISITWLRKSTLSSIMGNWRLRRQSKIRCPNHRKGNKFFNGCCPIMCKAKDDLLCLHAMHCSNDTKWIPIISLSLGTVPKTGLMLKTSCLQISWMRIFARERGQICFSLWNAYVDLLVRICVLFMSSCEKWLYHREVLVLIRY